MLLDVEPMSRYNGHMTDDDAIDEAVEHVVSEAGWYWAKVTEAEAVEYADAMIARLQAERDSMADNAERARRN